MNCQNLFEALKDKDPDLYAKVVKSIEIINNAMDMFSIKEIAISFNGGKDCTVILWLIFVFLHKQIITVYVTSDANFDKVEQFVDECIETYNLQVIRVPGGMKEALSQLHSDHPSIKAIFIGTRRSDPYSSQLDFFCKTDADWPEYTRIHPVLDWNYVDIWKFIRYFNIPFCTLYDYGYTSIGNKYNTLPNPNLKQNDTYLPAYFLQDDAQERSGRK